jgi:phosphinothricin acetyltransferase
MELRIRPATTDDVDAINAIHNHYALHATCLWQTELETAEGRRAWLAAHDEAHPVIVAEADGAVVGWAALSPYNSRGGWRHTVEDAVYVHPDRLAQEIGAALLGELVDRAARLGHHAIVAVISADQPASLRLHARHGFVEIGRLREAGFKFGRWLDAVYMQKLLGPPGR